MSQQLQYPQGQSQYSQPYGTNAPMGQQGNQPIGQQGYGVQSDLGFAESVPNEILTVVQELDHLETVCGWAHARAMDKGVPHVAKLCADLEEISHLQKELIVRQSTLAEPFGNATRQAIQNAVMELQQFGNQPEIREVITVGQQTVGTIGNALHRLQTFSTEGTGGQVGASQFGSQGMAEQYQQGMAGQSATRSQGFGQQGPYGGMRP